jgi:hypothetical protein
VDERYLAEVTRSFGSLALGTFRAKPYTFSLVLRIYLRVDRTAVWHKFLINKNVVPPDVEEGLSVLSLRPVLAVVLYQTIAFIGPDCLNKSIFRRRLRFF